MPMRLVFMGTSDFAVPCLAALLAAGHEVACVYTQPPRGAGRGMKTRPSPVQAFAEDRGLDVKAPATLKDTSEQSAFRDLDADAAVVVAYGLILPPPVLAAPRLGCINVHASLLPRWRGAAPIQRAILAGDDEAGVSIMQMDDGLDTGPVLATRAVPIAPDTTGGSLHDELAALGAEVLPDILADLDAGRLTPRPQPAKGVIYAEKLIPADGRLDWCRPAVELARTVRAFDPWPGAWFDHDGSRIKVLAARNADGSGEPGTILDDALTVACGDGALAVTRAQRPGKGAMEASAFLRGYALPMGTVLPKGTVQS
jgi:methionyl-tRNA formyltransferase